MRISSFLVFYLILVFKASHSATAELHPTANLSTTWTISYNLDILVRETDVAKFWCGFFCEGYCTSYIFAIFISPIQIFGQPRYQERVIWSANRDHPVSDSATMDFTAAGELVLKDVDGIIVWTTNTAGKSVAGMNLTDTGNLVLFDDKNSVVWQSFDHPTDSLLPGQNLYEGQKLITSASVFEANLSKGIIYSLQVTKKALVAYVDSNPPQAYYSRIVDYSDSDDTHKGRRYMKFLNGSFSFFIDSSKIESIDISPASSAQYMKLMSDGHLQLFHWQSGSEEWIVLTDITTSDGVGECGYPMACGRNSICSSNQQCSCPPIEYFRPVNDLDPQQGCLETTSITCNSTQDQGFITLENVWYFSFNFVNGRFFTSKANMEGVNMLTCKQACLNNCSCKAAIFQYGNRYKSFGTCYLLSELFTMESYAYNDALAFIKVQNVASHSLSHQVATVAGFTTGSFVLLLLVAIGLIMYVSHKRKKEAEMVEEYTDQVPGMPSRFSYEELKTATMNFSKKVGKGGYGSVFEGTLGDGTKIAVKCLEGLAHVKKSFLAEVQSIGSIHHVNLVRLRGFCSWKSQRLLVYDFMSNGSLDRWIYLGVRGYPLKWECRKKIILNIAKGLAYLHEECRQKIVHLDIKPQNILLDENFNAKVSDFGLSKLIDKNHTEVRTTIKGTPGYIAPEWRSSIITEKLDVYSFGIVLLEILCGRKNIDRSEPEESWHLLFVFQKCWEEGTLLDMVDRHSEDMQIHNTEVLEMMKLTSWCLQTNFKRRPSMSSVIKVLEGVMNVEPNLDYNFTNPRIQETEAEDEKNFTLLSPSLLSGPR